MSSIDALLQCLSLCTEATTLRHLSVIVPALFAMTGRITMLGISRWTDKGGSYRTIQRFFATPLLWDKLHWCLFRHHLFDADACYILAGDEVIVSKSGQHTYGLGRFFSSLYKRPVPGLCFFNFALINTKTRQAMPVLCEQVRSPSPSPSPSPSASASHSHKDTDEKTTEKEKKNPEEVPQRAHRKPGRPKGSKNKDKRNPDLSPYLRFIQTHLDRLTKRMSKTLPVTYLALDGAFGHNDALQMTRQCNMHLISKLKCNSALYFPYQGPYQGRGQRRIYGDKLNYDAIPEAYLKNTTRQGTIQTDIYHMTMRHETFADPITVVIIIKTHTNTHQKAHVVLFSSDLDLAYDKLIDYYSLRFQIEFTFRDAKQYWGLEDFMNITQTAVHNGANLAFFMVNLAHIFIQQARRDTGIPNWSVKDLKAHFTGLKYAAETLKLLPKKPHPIFIHSIYTHIAKLGAIRNT